MPLVRMTEKKLAANRANARLSKGPITPAGKEKVSRNACQHHLFARKFIIPPEWDARIRTVVNPAGAGIEDATQRHLLTRYLFLMLWIEELASFEARLLNQSIAENQGDCHRGTHSYATANPLFLPLQRKLHKLNLQANRARIDWERAQRTASICQTLPHLLETTAVAPIEESLTMAAAAGSASNHQIPASSRSEPRLSWSVGPLHPPAQLWYHRMRRHFRQFFEQPPDGNRLRNQ